MKEETPKIDKIRKVAEPKFDKIVELRTADCCRTCNWYYFHIGTPEKGFCTNPDNPKINNNKNFPVVAYQTCKNYYRKE